MLSALRYCDIPPHACSFVKHTHSHKNKYCFLHFFLTFVFRHTDLQFQRKINPLKYRLPTSLVHARKRSQAKQDEYVGTVMQRVGIGYVQVLSLIFFICTMRSIADGTLLPMTLSRHQDYHRMRTIR